MSFLRSLIKDARSDKSIADHGSRYQPTPRSQMEGQNHDVAEVKPESVESQNHTNFTDTFSPNQNSSDDINVSSMFEVTDVNSVNPARSQQHNEQENMHNISVEADVENSLDNSTAASDNASSLEPFYRITEMQDAQPRLSDVDSAEIKKIDTDEHSTSDTAESFTPSYEVETQVASAIERLPEQPLEEVNNSAGQQRPDQLDSVEETIPTQPETYLKTSSYSIDSSSKISVKKYLLSIEVDANEKGDSLNESLLSDGQGAERGMNHESNPEPDHFNELHHSKAISAKDGIEATVPAEVEKQQKMQSLSGQVAAPVLGKQSVPKTGDHKIYSVAEPVADSLVTSKQQPHSIIKQATHKTAAPLDKDNSDAVIPKSTRARQVSNRQDSTREDSTREDSIRQQKIPTVPAKLFSADSRHAASDNRNTRASTLLQNKREEVATVQIGQIDVIIEVPEKSASKPTVAPSTSDLASRHYLRSL